MMNASAKAKSSITGKRRKISFLTLKQRKSWNGRRTRTEKININTPRLIRLSPKVTSNILSPLFFLNKTVHVAVQFHLRIGIMLAKFFVDKRTHKGYICKDVKPKHKNNNGSKRTVNGGIFYGKTYEPGENTAYYCKKNGADGGTGKNIDSVRTVPGVAKINGIKHSGRKDAKNYKSEPVPKIGKIDETNNTKLNKNRFKQINKPSAGNNYHRKKIYSDKESNCINETEDKTGNFVSAVTFKNFAKCIRKHPESGSTRIYCGAYADDKQSFGLSFDISKKIFYYGKNTFRNDIRNFTKKKKNVLTEHAKYPLYADEHWEKSKDQKIRKSCSGTVELKLKKFFAKTYYSVQGENMIHKKHLSKIMDLC